MDRRAIEAVVLRHRDQLLAPETDHKLAMIDMPPADVLAWTRRILHETAVAAANPPPFVDAPMDTSSE
jgi:hypothetical protein